MIWRNTFDSVKQVQILRCFVCLFLSISLSIWKKIKLIQDGRRCVPSPQRFQCLSHPRHFQAQLSKAEARGWVKRGLNSFEMNATTLIGGHLECWPMQSTACIGTFYTFSVLQCCSPDKNVLDFIPFSKLFCPLEDDL